MSQKIFGRFNRIELGIVAVIAASGLWGTAMVVGNLWGNNPAAESRQPAVSSGGKSALESLERLSSRLDVGMNQMDYSRELGDIKFSIDKYIETSNAKANSEFTSALISALKGHLAALSFWKSCYSSTEEYYCFSNGQPVADLLAQYPQFSQDVSLYRPLAELPGVNVWHTQGVLNAIWRDVGKSVAVAKAQVSTSQ